MYSQKRKARLDSVAYGTMIAVWVVCMSVYAIDKSFFDEGLRMYMENFLLK